MGARPGAPRFELAEIVRTHRAALESSTRLSAAQRRVLTDIAQCRTAILGGHLDVCEQCGYERPSYNSCRNRHCPKCQALAQEKWIEQQHTRLLDQPHFHVVFTLPSELRSLAAFAPAVIYALLFECAGATLRDFGRSRLSAIIGATLVLHTWDKQLRYHPHIHAIVTAGGLRSDGEWIPTRQDFLFPVVAMSRVFRGKMRASLRRAYREGEFRAFDDFRDPEAFDRLHRRLGRVNWYVYAKRSFARARSVVKYLGRYTHRVALSNSRIVALCGDRVTIRTRGDGRAAMSCTELLRRFVRHVLPKGFHKIRHFGLYSSSKLAECPRPLLSTRGVLISSAERLRLLTGHDITRCPRCGNRVVSRALPSARAPPTTLVA